MILVIIVLLKLLALFLGLALGLCAITVGCTMIYICVYILKDLFYN